jgi:hypothetical protein
MELTDKEIHLLARLSRHRGLYAECKGVDLDILQKLGLIQWFDARSSRRAHRLPQPRSGLGRAQIARDAAACTR